MTHRSDDMESVLRESILAAHAEKHEMEQKAVDVAMEAAAERDQKHRVAHGAAHDAHEKIHAVAEQAHREQHAYEQRAVDVAVKAMDKRLDTMNGVWGQYREQGATFARREVVETIERQMQSFISRDVFDARIRELEKEVEAERTARRESEGVKRGMGQTTAIIVGSIGLVGVLLSIVVVAINFATGTPPQ